MLDWNNQMPRELYHRPEHRARENQMQEQWKSKIAGSNMLSRNFHARTMNWHSIQRIHPNKQKIVKFVAQSNSLLNHWPQCTLKSLLCHQVHWLSATLAHKTQYAITAGQIYNNNRAHIEIMGKNTQNQILKMCCDFFSEAMWPIWTTPKQIGCDARNAFQTLMIDWWKISCEKLVAGCRTQSV